MHYNCTPIPRCTAVQGNRIEFAKPLLVLNSLISFKKMADCIKLKCKSLSERQQ